MDIHSGGIIGQSSALRNVFKLLQKVSLVDSTVLVTGESGTGKELLVRALHNNSHRAKHPFVPINCGAIPRDLLESELFGHEKGAFTHAIRTRQGRFEMADGGTIFLDEIGEMDLNLQVKILRVLQEKEIEHIGGNGSKKVDVRIVAATNRDLEAEVAAGRFREDLYYRLNVIPIHLPPLRERGDDVLLLSEHFLRIFCKKKQRPLLKMSDSTQKILSAYAWPGNVRELENFMERLSILVDGDSIQPEDLPEKILNSVENWQALPTTKNSNLPNVEAVTPTFVEAAMSIEDFVLPNLAVLEQSGCGLKDFLESIENRLVDEALAKAQGVKNQAAEYLGIKRTTLIEKLKKRGL